MKTETNEQVVHSYSIRSMETSDMPQVMEIYRIGIAAQDATFETDESLSTWENNHFPNSRFVLVNESEQIIGWCALLKVHTQAYFQGIAETSIYLLPEFQGKGLGKILLEKLIIDSEEQGFWTLQAYVFAENIKSLKLHQKMGFQLVGKRNKLGKINDSWKDVLLLERRSKKI